MQIEVTTDHNIDGSMGLIRQIEDEVGSTLSRFSDRLSRVEVHIADENAGKSGADDKRCVLEARPLGQPPVAVTNNAATIAEACTGALRKLGVLLETKFGRLHDRGRDETIRHDEAT